MTSASMLEPDRCGRQALPSGQRLLATRTIHPRLQTTKRSAATCAMREAEQRRSPPRDGRNGTLAITRSPSTGVAAGAASRPRRETGCATQCSVDEVYALAADALLGPQTASLKAEAGIALGPTEAHSHMRRYQADHRNAHGSSSQQRASRGVALGSGRWT